MSGSQIEVQETHNLRPGRPLICTRIGSTKIHPFPNFPCVGSFTDADEIEVESGQIPGGARSYQVFLDGFLDRSEAASRTFRYVCVDVSEDASLRRSEEDSDHEASKRASEHGDKLFHESGIIVSEGLSGLSGGGSPISSKTSSNASESPQEAAYKA